MENKYLKEIQWNTFWYKWMLPSSLLALIIVPIFFCGYISGKAAMTNSLTNDNIVLDSIILGGLLGLAIGLLQWILIGNRQSLFVQRPKNWLWWLLISAVIWSVSSCTGIFVSDVIMTSPSSRGGLFWGGIMGIISWPIVVWGVGLAIQGIALAFSLQHSKSK